MRTREFLAAAAVFIGCSGDPIRPIVIVPPNTKLPTILAPQQPRDAGLVDEGFKPFQFEGGLCYDGSSDNPVACPAGGILVDENYVFRAQTNKATVERMWVENQAIFGVLTTLINYTDELHEWAREDLPKQVEQDPPAFMEANGVFVGLALGILVGGGLVGLGAWAESR